MKNKRLQVAYFDAVDGNRYGFFGVKGLKIEVNYEERMYGFICDNRVWNNEEIFNHIQNNIYNYGYRYLCGYKENTSEGYTIYYIDEAFIDDSNMIYFSDSENYRNDFE